ncbi:MAG TPA: xanthine dehydrogenase family protein molybdopterin-binding subunit [Thermoanaerobaculaceae bacterium]|nr:xanthine dehydrogenase family protein molybdopterin-binding subunit [Thermoanaerobaculaceae bacterium]
MKGTGPYLTSAGAPDPTAPAGTLPPWGETSVVGKPLPRIDAAERVSGAAVYTLDLQLPGMLHAAILRCPHAHARVKSVDASKAEAMPGVRAVLTASTPGAAIPWHHTEKGALSSLFDPRCRHEGEEVAAVAAETPHQAYDALRAIEVGYDVLPFVSDPERALEPGAPAVHEGGNRQGPPDVYERGDVRAGFAAADVVVEQTYRTPVQIHTPMEVHGSVARWEGDRLTLWDTTQGVFGVRSELARAFDLPLSSVRVISHYMGGGFGSKFELGKYGAIAALLARATGRPVKCTLTREDSFLCVGNRPSNVITLKAGVKRDGTLTAIEARLAGPVGAYPSGSTSAYLVADLYRCPNVRTEETDIYINAGQARPFRAPGFPPCSWALEQTIDTLAEKIGMDPIELRLRNIPTVSQLRKDRPYTSTGLAACLREGAKAFGWSEARRRPRGRGRTRRGVGVAAGMWGYPGEPNASAIVKVFADGSANLNTGASDLGTGTRTVLAQVVGEELGIAIERIEVENADTGTTQYAPASGGSQTVLVNAPAVRAAACAVKAELLAIAAEEMKRPASALTLRDGGVEVAGEPASRVPLSQLKGLARREVLVGLGARGPNPAAKVALPFVAQFAEVEVNTATGEVRVVRFVAAQDSGRVMNRLTYDSQVVGGITMGTGYALTEQRVLDRQTGKMVNANWHDYKLPTALDAPADVTVIPIDPHDTECNTTGAKGLGEPATIPTASAIANAVYDAVGIRVTDGPITPMRMAALLAGTRRGR